MNAFGCSSSTACMSSSTTKANFISIEAGDSRLTTGNYVAKRSKTLTKAEFDFSASSEACNFTKDLKATLSLTPREEPRTESSCEQKTGKKGKSLDLEKKMGFSDDAFAENCENVTNWKKHNMLQEESTSKQVDWEVEKGGEATNGIENSKLTSDKSTSLEIRDDIRKNKSASNRRPGQTLCQRLLSNQKVSKSKSSRAEEKSVIEADINMPGVEAVQCPKSILQDLAEPDFDVWRLDCDSVVEHIEYMYHDLGIVRAWKIPSTTLRMFLLGVRERYQDNPYHNFKHCFCVTQMAYSMICKLRLRNLISVDHLGALLTAAVCHDVDHPGLNNSYHSHARTPLAILYDYQSILEQHHFAVACHILSNMECNIFRNVNNRDEVLTNVGDLILATDLARHKDILADYTNRLAIGFDFKNSNHVMSLLKIIIKCADVSNEVRPETVASPWVERLFAEYSEQSAREKRERLPVTSYMDPDLVNVAESQEGFIRGVMLPLYDKLCKLMVEAQIYYIDPIHEALMRYEVQRMREQKI